MHTLSVAFLHIFVGVVVVIVDISVVVIVDVSVVVIVDVNVVIVDVIVFSFVVLACIINEGVVINVVINVAVSFMSVTFVVVNRNVTF